MFKMGSVKVIVCLILMASGVDCARRRSQRLKRCYERTLEQREEQANVVVTGTVRELFYDQQHPGQYRAELEVKRIFKGGNTIPNFAGDFRYKRALRSGYNKDYSGGGSGSDYDETGAHINSLEYLARMPKPMIIVDGIGDPSICNSKVRRHDTKIFLLSRVEAFDRFGYRTVGADGLKLNSSVISITLNHLEHAESAVKNIPYTPRVTSTAAKGLCERKYCPFGGECIITADNAAECTCITHCPDEFAPVCGTDNVTYASECRMKVASCTQEKRIIPRAQGSCDVADPCLNKECGFGAYCVPSLDGLAARCQCPTKCDRYGDSKDSVPICGSDGVDYANKCEMRRAACSEMRDVHTKYLGKCDPCHGIVCDSSQVCQLDDNREPVCRCNSLCTDALSPVCGTNGRTYSNECRLRVEACKQRKEIRVLFRKACEAGNNPCSTLICRDDQECHVDRSGEARCTCPPPCESVVRPVCGDNSQTYANECELRRAACQHTMNVRVAHEGECNNLGPCANYRCSEGTVCVLRDGVPTCESTAYTPTCPTCTEQYDPVCGDDRGNFKTYTNLCKLKAEGCERDRNILFVSKGLCNGCENHSCEHYAVCESNGHGRAQCTCPSVCPKVVDEVCGTDGITYSNECELRVASCQRHVEINIASHGSCDTCAGIQCKFGAVCEGGRCVCSQQCPSLADPVCGSDGQTYMNQCELRRQACAVTTDIAILHAGECDDEMYGQESGSGDICDESTCSFGGSCDFDMDGDTRCVCAFNCDAIRSPVCGSDGHSYGNECQLREEQCRRQSEISIRASNACENIDEELCDGNPALINPSTGRDYNCETGRETCPSDSYCHRVNGRAKCCQDDQNLQSCEDSPYGCCADMKTAAPGNNYAGCPESCGCHLLGSSGRTCNPRTNQCSCKPGVGGLKCDRCEPGYWGLPKIADGNTGCIPCGCNVFGSTRDDCEQMTGRCVCNPHISGEKCNLCPSGIDLGPRGCSSRQGPIRSCYEMTCRYGAVCSVHDSVATCDCHMSCQQNSYVTVCGTDGNTYASHCELNLFSCRLQREIQVAYEGSCSANIAVGDTTASTPSRSRKTTRHVHDDPPSSNRVTTRVAVGPTDSTNVKFGFITDFCFTNDDCHVDHSFCKSGVCTCNKGYTSSDDNANCLEMTFEVPSFAGRSYLSFRHLDRPNRDITIKLRFKTLNNDGILLYNGQRDTGHGDFIAIIVREQRVEFRFDLGSGMLVLRSTQMVELNRFHHVVARRFGQDGMLQLDDGPQVTGSSPGTLKSLNLGASLHLGFVPAMTEEIYSNVGVEVGLVGCIEALEITIKDFTKQYNLVYPGSSDIITGKGIGECGENPCNSLPCQHGSTCIKVDNDSYECLCPTGWVGSTCSIDESKSACTPTPCLAGGTCAPLPESNFACLCPDGRSGMTCEHGQTTDISVPQFHENSFLELPLTASVGETLSLEVWFLATKPTGVILYSSQQGTNSGDFISLSLQGRYLQFRYDLGSGIANITSSRKVPLNVWHRVNIARNNRHGSLIVNGGIPVEGDSKGNLNELNLGETIFIGGHPSEYNRNVGIGRGLSGAVQKVFENGQLLDDIVSRSTRLIGLTQYEGGPCPLDDNPCSNDGLCIPQLNEYECKCTPQFIGKHCDKNIQNLDLNLPIAFDGHTAHKYYNLIDQKLKSEPSNKYTIRFRTESSSGLLLLLHKSSTVEGDYLALAISNGRVECSFNLGKQSSSLGLLIMSSLERVDDGEWHTVVFNRVKRKGTLSVDGGDAVVALSEDGVSQLDTNGWMWIGGAHRIPSGLPEMYHDGFNGCIASVSVNDQPLNLLEDRQSHGSAEFCSTK